MEPTEKKCKVVVVGHAAAVAQVSPAAWMEVYLGNSSIILLKSARRNCAPNRRGADVSQMTKSGLMDLAQAAEYLGVKVSSMRWLRRTGRLPFFRLGQRLRIRKDTIDKYIEAQEAVAAGGQG